MVCFKCSPPPCGRDSFASNLEHKLSPSLRHVQWIHLLQAELACGLTSVAPLEEHQQAAATLMLTQGFAGRPESPTFLDVQ